MVVTRKVICQTLRTGHVKKIEVFDKNMLLMEKLKNLSIFKYHYFSQFDDRKQHKWADQPED